MGGSHTIINRRGKMFEINRSTSHYKTNNEACAIKKLHGVFMKVNFAVVSQTNLRYFKRIY
jgi:penicillin-binding protein-related factor A (putative recombinase)